MKNYFLAILSAVIAVNTYATTITVSNNVDSPGQYTNLQTAINNAGNGDTLLVSGSNTSYGNITVNNKAVHIIGAGYSPNKQFPYPTTLDIVTFGQVAGGSPQNTASGSSIKGCKLNNSLKIEGTSTITSYVENIEVSRCWLSNNNVNHSIRYVNNLIVANCILGGNFNLYNNVNNAIVSNSIFTRYIRGSSSNSSIIVSNNLFINNYPLSPDVITEPNNTIFSNNIFIGAQIYSYSVGGNCSFNNNIFYCTDNTLPTGNGNTFSGNIIGTNPQFTNPGTLSSGSYAFTSTHNYHLSGSSIGVNAGTDGTDIGLYGGGYPWPDGGADGSGFMYSQEVDIPQVNELNILNNTVPQNGTLNVTVLGITNP